jgi:4-azaleucine resistance transporter AzlC
MQQKNLLKSRRAVFCEGARDGIPIALGYFAVSIALGIAAKKAGLTSFQAALTSLLINASAGEYAGFTLIAAHAAYIEVAVMEAVANARYLLMSAALSQKLEEKMNMWQRLLLGFTVTDEIFGVSVAIDGKLSPFFTYGTFVVATAGWTSGTFVGAILGEVLPVSLISALGVGLYGMFISVFIPEAKKNKIVAALVLISFSLSFAFAKLPVVSDIPEGIRIILLTVVISLGAALLFPIKEREVSDNE